MRYPHPSRVMRFDELTQQDEFYIVGCADAGSEIWCRSFYPSDKAWLIVMTVLANSSYATRKQRDIAWQAIEKYKQKATIAMKQKLCEQRRATFDRNHEEKMLALIDRGDQTVCSECGSTDDLTIDHIIPLSRGGTDDLANLRFLCRSCNSKKRDRVSPDVLENLDRLGL